MGNAVVYFEIGAANAEPLRRFYSDLFGWNLNTLDSGYTLIDTGAGAGLNGGIGRSNDGTPWATFYVETDDPLALLDKATSLGGKIVLPVTYIPNVGTWAMFNDPDGLLVGLYKPAGGLNTTPSSGKGTAVDWFEVLGSDPKRTWSFYSELFGWTSSGQGPYWLVDTGAGHGIGGGVGAGGGAQWATIYAHVEDIERALGRAQELGGKREYGPIPVDDHMRTGAFRDPAGNVVGVYEHKH
jgi:predicted enzyme related to lactoylglutathione lyase